MRGGRGGQKKGFGAGRNGIIVLGLTLFIPVGREISFELGGALDIDSEEITCPQCLLSANDLHMKLRELGVGVCRFGELTDLPTYS